MVNGNSTGWVVRYLDEHGHDNRDNFYGPRGFMAARQLHALLAKDTRITDLEILRPVKVKTTR